MKKFSTLAKLVFLPLTFLVFSLLVAPPIARAEELSSSADGAQDSVFAYIENEHGERKEIEGHLVSAVQPLNFGGDKSQTYVFSISSTDLGTTKEQFDGSYSVKAYLTIWTRESADGLSVLLTRVNGRWEVYDSSVTVNNVNLRYGCDDASIGGVQARWLGSVGNYFSYSTNYRKYAAISAGVVGANIEVDMKHGSESSWTLYLQNNYCNNFPSWFNTR